jgi:DNA-binding MarR family transcriptional regulator
MLFESKITAIATLIGDLLSQANDDVSSSAIAVLMTLMHWSPMSASELARRVGVSQPTMARVTGGLIKAGYVRQGPRIERANPLRLTAKGRHKARRLRELRANALREVFSPLSETERAELLILIDKVLYHATNSRGFAQRTCRFCDHELCIGDKCPVGTRATELEQTERQGS